MDTFESEGNAYNQPMISVLLSWGAWYVEPIDVHIYLHVVGDEQRRKFVATVAHTEEEAIRFVRKTSEYPVVHYTISLFDLLESTRRMDEENLHSSE